MKKLSLVGIASILLTVISISLSTPYANGQSVTKEATITLQDTCTFSRTEGNGEYSGVILPGSYSENFASSVLSVACNTPDVYYVTAHFSNLTDENNENNIINYTTTNPNGSFSGWSVKAGKTIPSQTYVENDSRFIDATTADDGITTTIRYSVSASPDQPSGSYSGTATYILISGNN